MLNIIDDDEWFELSLALNATVAQLPPGSRLVEAMSIPPFRAAIRASGHELDAVATVSGRPYARTRSGAISAAIDLATAHNDPDDGGVAIALTQTEAGESVAVAVAGLPGERCSFTSFELKPGSHSIDVAFDVLALLPGWAIRSSTTPRRTERYDAA